MNLNWQTPPKLFEETVQVTDGYVVHGRGWTIGEDIWFDEYALRSGHHSHWNNVLKDEYGFPEWPGGMDWSKYAEGIDPYVVYWSITGAPTFLVQFPFFNDMEERHWELLGATLEEMQVPTDDLVTFDNNDTSKQMKVSDILEKA